MGQGQSAQLAQTQFSWLLKFADSAVSYASHVSLECFEQMSGKVLAVAYQASDARHEGARTQHLRFALSKDGGETWSPPKVVVFGGMPIWNPVLFFDKESNRLFLFYSESRKTYTPGGDIKYITTKDAGATWTPPVTIYTHEADGEVPKVTANKPIVASDGTWYLPVHREPPEAYRTFNAKTFHPMRDVGVDVPKVVVPGTATPQGTSTSACVLISNDRAATWRVGGSVQDPKTWLIDASIEEGSKKQLVMLMRSAAGRVYTASSTDRGTTWSKPTYTSLPNPNSKFSTLTIDGQVLIVYNNSATTRAPLSLALSVDDGRSWEPLTVIEADPKGNFSSPAIAEWSEDTVKVAYTVWGEGLKLATVKLATVES